MRTIALFATLASACSAPAPVCDPACAAGFTCQDGACVSDGKTPPPDGGAADAAGCDPACGGATPRCNASRHCVGCTADADCPLGMRCRVVSDAIANCAPGCTGDDRCASGACCDGACVDTTSDPAHCGGCGNACPSQHAQASCVASTCKSGACDPGWGDCDGDPANGCETNLGVDPANCTACGEACAVPHGSPGCADGCYLAACQFGWADCNGEAKDGCETHVDADPANCGDCGVACKNPPNAVAVCSVGACFIASCTQGWFDCDGDAGNGCEANLAFDSHNCGGCGNQCPVEAPACNGGACEAGFAGLAMYWKFDGNFNDAVGGFNLSAPPQTQLPGFAAGEIGQATNSPMGDPQCLWVSPLPNVINNSADFTLAFWARNNTTTWYDTYSMWDSGGLIVYRHLQDNWRFIVWTQNVNNQYVLIDSGVNLPKPPDSTWYFVVVERSGDTLGIRINDGAPVTAAVGQLKQGPVLYVSRMTSGYSWPGQLDEMGYWTRALTDGEINELYNAGKGRTFP